MIKKFTEYNNPKEDDVVTEQDVMNPSIDASILQSEQTVDILKSFTETYKSLTENIEKAEEFSTLLQQVEENINHKIDRDEVEKLFTTHLLLVNENIHQIKTSLQGINEEDLEQLHGIVEQINDRAESVSKYVDLELPKLKKTLFETTHKTDLALSGLNGSVVKIATAVNDNRTTVEQQLEEIKEESKSNLELFEETRQEFLNYVSDIYEDIKQVNGDLQQITEKYNVINPAIQKINEFETKLDTVITEQNNNLDKAKEEIKQVINEVNTIFINDKYIELDKKVDKIEEIFNSLNNQPTQVLTENSTADATVAELNKVNTNKSFQQPNPDEVTANFSAITAKLRFLEQSIGRIAATGPGGGEVNLRWLDDVDRSTIANGKFLRYNSTKKKFEFVTVEGGGGGGVQADWTQTDDTDPSFILNKPTIPAAQIQSDWTQSNNSALDYIKNKPTLATVATSGSYTDLTNKPTIPAAQIKSDWTETNTSLASFILNKPTLFSGSYTDLTNKPSLFSGDYNDLTNKPSIPAAQIQSDWNQSNNTSLDYIKNKPTLFSGSYTDLTNKPTIPAALTDLTDVSVATPTNGQVLKYNSSTGKWYNGADATGSGGTASDGYWGAFFSTDTVTNAGVTSANLVTVNNSDPDNNGVSVVSGSQFTVANGGVYNIQFSFQFVKTNSSTDTVDIWIRKNGNLVPDTNSRITLSGNGQHALPAWNFVMALDANDYIQFYWSSTDSNMKIETIDGSLTNPTRPAIPSAIVTLQAVAQVLNGLQVQSDWTQTNTSAVDYIQNKPSLATVATSGSYTDLTSKPTIPDAQVNSDWNSVSGVSQILNKPTLFSGSYTDLTNKPSLFSGSYTDLTNKPTIPTVYDSTITISAGTGMSGGGTFTLNQSGTTTVTLSSTITQYTDALARSAISLSTGSSTNGGALSYNSSTGAFTYQPATAYTLPTASGSTLGGVKVGTGLAIDGSGVLSASGSPTFTNITTTGQIIESFQTYSTSIGSTQPITLDCTSGNIFNVTSTVTQNWTAAFTNVAVTTGKATNTTLIINQGVTPYIPNAISVNGTSSTINWQGGSAPTGNPSKKDVVSFSILQTGASTYLVFGQLVTFG